MKVLKDGGGGITEVTKKFIEKNLSRLIGKREGENNIYEILLIPEERFNDLEYDVEEFSSYNMVVTTNDDVRFLLSGFYWGYGGEGPHGLAWFFKKFNFLFNIQDISKWKMNENHRIYRSVVKGQSWKIS